MAHRQTARRWLRYLFFAGLMFLLAGCDGPGGEGCGGVDAFAACLNITRIQPIDGNGTETSDVDVIFNPDCNGDGIRDDPEPFTRHDATVTFSNEAFPTADEGLPITVQRFTVSYSLVICPQDAICPPLSGFSETVSLSVPEGATVSGQFALVPISVKDEFIDQGGTASAFPTYSANYTFVGETDFFEDAVTLQSSVSFVMGNFNNCQTTL